MIFFVSHELKISWDDMSCSDAIRIIYYKLYTRPYNATYSAGDFSEWSNFNEIKQWSSKIKLNIEDESRKWAMNTNQVGTISLSLSLRFLHSKWHWNCFFFFVLNFHDCHRHTTFCSDLQSACVSFVSWDVVFFKHEKRFPLPKPCQEFRFFFLRRLSLCLHSSQIHNSATGSLNMW